MAGFTPYTPPASNPIAGYNSTPPPGMKAVSIDEADKLYGGNRNSSQEYLTNNPAGSNAPGHDMRWVPDTGGAAGGGAAAPIAGLQAAVGGGSGGAGDGGSGGIVNVPPPAKPDASPVSVGGGSGDTGGINVGESIQGLRQGLGTRTPPSMMSALAQLGRIY